MSTASRISIRPAEASDGPALGRLGAMLVALHHDFDPDRFIPPGPRTEGGYASFLAGQIGHRDAIVLVADAGGEVIGYAYAGLEGSDWMLLRGPAGVIYDLLVDPARRGEGVGRTLLRAMLEALRARGAPRVVLSTAYRNEAAQRFFARAGFRATMVELTREWPSQT